ncbi:MAG: tetratricopeptide repeat protein, partial [Elusimicrobiota bacterium]
LNTAIKLNPVFKEAYILRAQLYKKKGGVENIKKSKQDLLTVKRISESKIPYTEGLNNFYNEQFDTAIQLFTTSIKLNPFDPNIYNIRGLAYINKNKPNNAMADFNKAIELNPNFVDAYNNRATLYASKKKYESALTDLNKIIELEPNSPEAYYNIGLICQMKDNYEESIKYFTESINHSKEKPNDITYYSRGYSYYVLGDFVQANKDFLLTLKLNPSNTEAQSYRQLALVNLKKQKSENKVKNLDTFIKLKSPNKSTK